MDALEMTLLFDYYGDLLTERQKCCLDMRYNQDMSLGEIAQELGVSRQGVHDNLSRAEALLRSMEETTGCVQRAQTTRSVLTRVQKALGPLLDYPDEQVKVLANQIRSAIEELEE